MSAHCSPSHYPDPYLQIGALKERLRATEEEVARLKSRQHQNLDLLPILAEAMDAMKEESSNQESDPFGFDCPNCDGALPLLHSLGCRIRNAVLRAERAR